MTSTQVYGLMAPLLVVGLGWFAYWSAHRQIIRLRGERPAARPGPAA
jgi:hypothetical protein